MRTSAISASSRPRSARATPSPSSRRSPAASGSVPVFDSVADLIGNTPIVDVSKLSPNPRARILAKLEGQNPGGSVKDRAAKAMLDEAEKDGSLQPGQTILESS